MKRLKVYLAVLANVLVFSVFSQSSLMTTFPISGYLMCDGSAFLDTTMINTNVTTIWWKTFQNIQTGGFSINNLCAGTYRVDYAPLNSTSLQSHFFTIQDPCIEFSAKMEVTPVTDPLSPNGTASIHTTGGTAPYTYSWNNGATDQALSGLSSGNYCCIVKDVYGCPTSANGLGLPTPECNRIHNYFPGGFIGDTRIEYLYENNTCSFDDVIDTFSIEIEDCHFNYNLYMSAWFYPLYNFFPDNSIDTLNFYLDIIYSPYDLPPTEWCEMATRPYSFEFPLESSLTSGCYLIRVKVYCYDRPQIYNAFIFNTAQYIGFAGVEELNVINEKTIVKITDIMGRECELVASELRIVLYNDGTIKKVIAN